MDNIIKIRAEWDEEAKVWVASSEDISGLSTEAATLEALRQKIQIIVPELIELNGFQGDFLDIPLHLYTEDTISRPVSKCN